MKEFRKNVQMKNGQNGVALVAALVALLLISAITAGMIILSNTETNISTNFKDEQLAYFSAKAGIEEARDRLRNNTTPTTDSLRSPTSVLPTTAPGSGTTGVLYILNPANGETVAPWNNANKYVDTEICKETSTVACSSGTSPLPSSSSGWYTHNTANDASTTYAASPVMVWKWVRITLKQNNSLPPYNNNGTNGTGQVYWDGSKECLNASATCRTPQLPVYNLTALAVTPSGSRRMVQAEVAEDVLTFNAPGALTEDGTGDSFSGGNSANWSVIGTDAPAGASSCNVTPTGVAVHSVAVAPGQNTATIISGMPRPANYTGMAAAPDVAAVTMPTNMQTITELQALMSSILANESQPSIPNNGSISNYGTLAQPQTIYATGDLDIGPITGYGILAVAGNLTVHGNANWNGLILVIGKGSFTTSGTPQYNGAIIVAQTVDPVTGLTLLTPGPGVATFNANGGGNGGIQYSSGCIANASQLSTFHIMAYRELMN